VSGILFFFAGFEIAVPRLCYYAFGAC